MNAHETCYTYLRSMDTRVDQLLTDFFASFLASILLVQEGRVLALIRSTIWELVVVHFETSTHPIYWLLTSEI